MDFSGFDPRTRSDPDSWDYQAMRLSSSRRTNNVVRTQVTGSQEVEVVWIDDDE